MILFMKFLIMKYSELIYSLSIDGSCCDLDNTDDDDDEICYIHDYREDNDGTMENFDSVDKW